MPPDLASVRVELPCLAEEVYLNCGGAGPQPMVVAAAIGRALAAGMARGPAGMAAVASDEAELAGLRADVAALLGAPAREIALTANTTWGLDTVIWGVDLGPGDEAVTTALEHPGLVVPLAARVRRAGARLHVIGAAEAQSDLAGAVASRAGARTRLVALSHVAYGTGARLDVEGAARAARAAGALVLVDGAQAVGAIPVDPRALGVDAYAFPAHKWLLGPPGVGALWVAEEAVARIDLAFAGYESGTEHRPDGGVALHAGARRYEASTPPTPLLPGWRAALGWLRGLGWQWIHSRIAAVQAAARERLAAIPGLRVLTPPGPQAGLVTVAPGAANAEEACRRLASRGVTVRWLGEPPALRAAPGFYTDEGDLDRLEAEMRALGGLIRSRR